jgi:hypothetical protein
MGFLVISQAPNSGAGEAAKVYQAAASMQLRWAAGVIGHIGCCGALLNLRGGLMPKYFFYLKGDSDSLEGSFGLRYFEKTESAAIYARTIAQQLQPDFPYQGFSVLATDQGGTEIARVPVAQRAVRLPRQRRPYWPAGSRPRKYGTQ